MARGPFSTTNRIVTSSVFSAYPLTVAGWVKTSSISASDNILFTMAAPVATDWFTMSLSSGKVSVASRASAGGAFAALTTTATTNDTWTHFCGIWASSTSRTAFINGADKTINTGSAPVNFANLTETQFGGFRSASAATAAVLAGCGVWNVALTDAEVESLADGFDCQHIRPASLVHQIPLIRSNTVLRGNMVVAPDLAADAHPPIIGAIAA
jgi:hypothetical protein